MRYALPTTGYISPQTAFGFREGNGNVWAQRSLMGLVPTSAKLIGKSGQKARNLEDDFSRDRAVRIALPGETRHWQCLGVLYFGSQGQVH